MEGKKTPSHKSNTNLQSTNCEQYHSYPIQMSLTLEKPFSQAEYLQ